MDAMYMSTDSLVDKNKEIYIDIYIYTHTYIHRMEHYSVIKRNEFESVVVKWMNLLPVIQSEVSQKEKNKHCILMHMCIIYKDHFNDLALNLSQHQHLFQ